MSESASIPSASQGKLSCLNLTAAALAFLGVEAGLPELSVASTELNGLTVWRGHSPQNGAGLKTEHKNGRSLPLVNQVRSPVSMGEDVVVRVSG